MFIAVNWMSLSPCWELSPQESASGSGPRVKLHLGSCWHTSVTPGCCTLGTSQTQTSSSIWAHQRFINSGEGTMPSDKNGQKAPGKPWGIDWKLLTPYIVRDRNQQDRNTFTNSQRTGRMTLHAVFVRKLLVEMNYNLTKPYPPLLLLCPRQKILLLGKSSCRVWFIIFFFSFKTTKKHSCELIWCKHPQR